MKSHLVINYSIDVNSYFYCYSLKVLFEYLCSFLFHSYLALGSLPLILVAFG